MSLENNFSHATDWQFDFYVAFCACRLENMRPLSRMSTTSWPNWRGTSPPSSSITSLTVSRWVLFGILNLCSVIALLEPVFGDGFYIFDVGLLTYLWSSALTKPPLLCRVYLMVSRHRRAGPTPARNSVRNCWNWSGGWLRMTRMAWWHTRSSTCCGTWRTATTSQWTSWTRRSALTSRSWITAAPRFELGGSIGDV